MSIKLRGLKSTMRGMQTYRKRFVEAVDPAAEAEARALGADSQVQVPVDTGETKNSMQIRKIVDRAGRVIWQVQYTSDDAIFSHEMPPGVVSHNVGKWKYLEDPVKARTRSAARRMARDVGRRVA